MTPDRGRPLLDPAEVEEIDLQVLERVEDLVYGEHGSIYSSTSHFDFTGLREWQPGDAQARIDWAHSTVNAFSPLVVRESVEPHALDVMIAADASPSTRCGRSDVTIARVVARALATIGFSAALFQDSVGLVLYDFAGERAPWIEPPHRGRAQILRLIELYEAGCTARAATGESLAAIVSRELGRTSLVFVISDFLFPDAGDVIRELAGLRPRHDVVIGMVDAAFAFVLPAASAGWIECADAETGRTTILSARAAARLPARVAEYQAELARCAERADVDLVSLGDDPDRFHVALLELFIERRLHRRW
jgi:uncharacterized protein (DUF58 family)